MRNVAKTSKSAVQKQLQMALALVESNTDEDWAFDALAVIEQVCRQRPDFISDDIWDAGLRSTHNDKALGPVMMRAARLGWCMKSDRVRPSRRSHLSGKPVWISQLSGRNGRT